MLLNFFIVQRPWILSNNTDLAQDGNSSSFAGFELFNIVKHLRWTSTCTPNTVICLNLNSGMWQCCNIIRKSWFYQHSHFLNWHLSSVNFTLSILDQVLSLKLQIFKILSTLAMDPALRVKTSINPGDERLMYKSNHRYYFSASLWLRYLG